PGRHVADLSSPLISRVFVVRPGIAFEEMKSKIRIAAGQGFWGDLPDAPVRQVEGGSIDYLMLDYLAEVTMSIMQKQKARDPAAGYARDSVQLTKETWPVGAGRCNKAVA